MKSATLLLLATALACSSDAPGTSANGLVITLDEGDFQPGQSYSALLENRSSNAATYRDPTCGFPVERRDNGRWVSLEPLGRNCSYYPLTPGDEMPIYFSIPGDAPAGTYRVALVVKVGSQESTVNSGTFLVTVPGTD